MGSPNKSFRRLLHVSSKEAENLFEIAHCLIMYFQHYLLRARLNHGILLNVYFEMAWHDETNNGRIGGSAFQGRVMNSSFLDHYWPDSPIKCILTSGSIDYRVNSANAVVSLGKKDKQCFVSMLVSHSRLDAQRSCP